MSATKRCNACGLEVPLEGFEARFVQGRGPYYHSKCRACRNAQRREAAAKWYAANADAHKAGVSARRRAKRAGPES